MSDYPHSMKNYCLAFSGHSISWNFGIIQHFLLVTIIFWTQILRKCCSVFATLSIGSWFLFFKLFQVPLHMKLNSRSQRYLQSCAEKMCFNVGTSKSNYACETNIFWVRPKFFHVRPKFFECTEICSKTSRKNPNYRNNNLILINAFEWQC